MGGAGRGWRAGHAAGRLPVPAARPPARHHHHLHPPRRPPPTRPNACACVVHPNGCMRAARARSRGRTCARACRRVGPIRWRANRAQSRQIRCAPIAGMHTARRRGARPASRWVKCMLRGARAHLLGVFAGVGDRSDIAAAVSHLPATRGAPGHPITPSAHRFSASGSRGARKRRASQQSTEGAASRRAMRARAASSPSAGRWRERWPQRAGDGGPVGRALWPHQSIGWTIAGCEAAALDFSRDPRRVEGLMKSLGVPPTLNCLGPHPQLFRGPPTHPQLFRSRPTP